MTRNPKIWQKLVLKLIEMGIELIINNKVTITYINIS